LLLPLVTQQFRTNATRIASWRQVAPQNETDFARQNVSDDQQVGAIMLSQKHALLKTRKRSVFFSNQWRLRYFFRLYEMNCKRVSKQKNIF